MATPRPASFADHQQAVSERLLPSLLDRLSDDHPEARQDSYADRVVSFQQYQKGVQRDLAWLLSATGHLPEEAISQFPEVASSVLNFGVPPFTGRTDRSLPEEQFRLRVLDAIKLFEPRVLSEGLEVSVVAERSVITLDLDGNLWAVPAPERFYLKTSIDLETGRCDFGRQPNG